MKRALSVVGMVAVAMIGAGCAPAPGERTEITVYKTAACGCCKDWIRHLEANGFAVKAYDVQNLAQIKRQHGVNPRLGSCHTARVGNYVIEGHVPAHDIKHLLAEQPAVAGLAVPGMPAGSPGMAGSRKVPYTVYTFNTDGSAAVYARY